MTDALRFEGVRLSTIRSTYWSLSLGLLLCGLVALGFGLDTRGTNVGPAEATLLLTAGRESLPFSLMGFAAALVGIFATGHEYRYGTILPLSPQCRAGRHCSLPISSWWWRRRRLPPWR